MSLTAVHRLRRVDLPRRRLSLRQRIRRRLPEPEHLPVIVAVLLTLLLVGYLWISAPVTELRLRPVPDPRFTPVAAEQPQ